MSNPGRWFSQHLLAWGAPGLFLLALVDSGLVPIPQGVDLLLFAQVVAEPRLALLLAALATTGSLLGCLLLYTLSRQGGEAALKKRTSPERIASIRNQIERHQALSLVLPTMIPLPVPTKLFVIAAGVFQVRLSRFTLAVLFGRLVRYFGIAFLAQRYGEQTWTFLGQHALVASLAAVCLLGLFYAISRRMR